MKFLNIESVEPGQYLGKTIFSANGAVLLAESVQLTVFMINTLRRIGVTMLSIKDPQFDDVEVEDVVSEEKKRAVMTRVGDAFEAIRSGKEFNTKPLSVSVDRMLDDVYQNREVLLQLTDIRTHDNAMYVHALNVSAIASLIGINMLLNQIQLKELAIGALLHDVGKVDILADDSMTDPRKHHTWRGFEMLKNKREFSLLIAHVAFQHHEWLDGTGLPRRMTYDQIHPYARIVSVANLYDNLLYNPETGKRMLPHHASELMTAMAGTKIDRDVMIQFLRIVSIYPTGTSVKLTTKETGVVVGQHRGLPGRPVVRVVRQDPEGELDVKEVDLAKQHTVFIDAVLS